MVFPTLINNKRLLRPLILVITILVVLFIGYQLTHKNSSSSGVVTQNKGNVKSQKITLNQTFDLALPSKQNDLKPLKVTFTTAQITNRISIGGKSKYSSDKTRFLMVNLLIENQNTRRINLQTRDVIRLIDTSGKKFPPRYFNKSVSIEADAARKDVVGFLVPEEIKEFNIQYGLPTDTDKKIINLKFQ